jgi:hypothetical protein
VNIVALTNLPDGTLYLATTERGGMCCPAVEGGRVVLRASPCDLVSGSHTQGMSITITVDPDIGRHLISVPLGGEPPEQPDSVLAILGSNFENLTGDQVVDQGDGKVLVATADYAWPQSLCLDSEEGQ